MRLLFLCVVSALLISCVNEEDSSEYEYSNLSYKGRDIAVSAPSPQQGVGLTDFSISNLFDENPETVWSPLLNCQTEIQFVFSEPVYIADITVLNGFASTEDQYNKNNRAKTVVVSTYKDEEFNPTFGDYFSHTLSDVPTPEVISFMNGGLSSVLRTKTLSLEVVDCYEASADAKIGLREISINFSNEPLFKPTMTVEEIRSKFVSDERKWYIAQDNNYELIDEVMANLMYEGLKGNEGAETLFYNYSPTGAHSGEIHSYLVEWYELTKKYRAL